MESILWDCFRTFGRCFGWPWCDWHRSTYVIFRCNAPDLYMVCADIQEQTTGTTPVNKLTSVRHYHIPRYGVKKVFIQLLNWSLNCVCVVSTWCRFDFSRPCCCCLPLGTSPYFPGREVLYFIHCRLPHIYNAHTSVSMKNFVPQVSETSSCTCTSS